MTHLQKIIDHATQIIAAHEALAPLYDPDAQPLRQHLTLEREQAIRDSEASTLRGIFLLEEGLNYAKAQLEDPDIHDAVKADILVRMNVLVNGLGDA